MSPDLSRSRPGPLARWFKARAAVGGSVPRAAPEDPSRFTAEHLLAEAQLEEPCLLGLDVGIALDGRLLCRSGRGDLRPRAELGFGADRRLLVLALPEAASPDQERACVALALALQRAWRAAPVAPARGPRAAPG